MNLTGREKEIMKILTQNPMISQEELAGILSISRSATAVHISNLIKKGEIVGRGYVLNQSRNIILLGKIFASVVTDNVQEIKLIIDGTGYLLSTGLANLGEKVILISALGEDFLGRSILAEIEFAGIDKRNLFFGDSLPTAIKVETVPGNQKLIDGVLQNVTVQLLLTKEHLFKNAQFVIIDGSFGVKLCLQMLSFCKKYSIKSICVLTDSQDITSFFNTEILIKMNTAVVFKRQLKQLGINQIRFEELISQNVFPLHPNGQLVVLCEEEGILIITKDNTKQISLLPGQKLKGKVIVGLIYGIINGYTLSQAARIGLGSFEHLKQAY